MPTQAADIASSVCLSVCLFACLCLSRDGAVGYMFQSQNEFLIERKKPKFIAVLKFIAEIANNCVISI